MKFQNSSKEINLMPNGTRWVDINEIKHVMTPQKQGYSEEEVLELWNWLNDGFIIRKSLPTREELIGWFQNLKTNKMKEQRLDCPYDFTSRCTMGRCDCKPKEELPIVNGSYGCVIETKKMEKQQQGYSKEDLRQAYFSAIKSTGEGWNGEYTGGNHLNIEENFTEGFEEWFEQSKNK